MVCVHVVRCVCMLRYMACVHVVRCMVCACGEVCMVCVHVVRCVCMW